MMDFSLQQGIGPKWHLPEYDTYFRSRLTMSDAAMYGALHCCTSHRVAVDAGAHVGTWTLPLCGMFKRVWAFEPSLDNFECLLKNTAGCKNLHRIWGALGSEETECFIKNDEE